VRKNKMMVKIKKLPKTKRTPKATVQGAGQPKKHSPRSALMLSQARPKPGQNWLTQALQEAENCRDITHRMIDRPVTIIGAEAPRHTVKKKSEDEQQ
jgi:hypothetical protein